MPEMQRLALCNARLLDPASKLDITGGILIDQGKIAGVGAEVQPHNLAADIRQLDLYGQCVAPGLVDMRALLPGDHARHKETLETASLAAVAGGITTFVCASDSQPALDSPAALHNLLQRGREIGLANIHGYTALSQSLQGQHLAEFALLDAAGSMGFMDGNRAVSNPRLLLNAMRYSRLFDKMILTHAVDPCLQGQGVMNQGGLASKLGLSGIPALAELLMIERDIRLAEASGARLHLCHISTADAVEAVRQAKKRGLTITCDVTPAHFHLDEQAVDDYRTFAKLMPPLRTQTDIAAIMDGLQDGTIDAIASDHCPQDQDSKRVPFAQAAFGMVGFETLLSLTLKPALTGNASLLGMLRKITAAPAQLLGLPVGTLRVGTVADLVIFDLHATRVLEPAHLHSKSKNTPFIGHNLPVAVNMTVKHGNIVFRHQSVG